MRLNLKVTFYTKDNCSLCDLAHEMIINLGEEESFELEMIDITKSPEAWEAYREKIPVIKVGEASLWGRIVEGELRDLLHGKM